MNNASSSSSSPVFITSQNFLSPYEIILQALLLIPISHYFIGFLVLFVVFLYRLLECHLIRDIITGFRGQSVTLTFHPESKIYEEVVSKCKLLHGKYLATPWLSSPHLQTYFINYYGRPPVFRYRRQIFQLPDGGTIALDWLMNSDVNRGVYAHNIIPKDDRTPIVFVVPGLTSDSNSTYLRHLVYNTAKCGRNVVIINHRGLGGVPMTTDRFYNAATTDDIRAVVHHLHCEYPDAPLFGVGTSIGASLLVKYLGQGGKDVPVAGAAAICSPYDFVVCDRAMGRGRLQKIYDNALAGGLRDFAQLHEARYSRYANWEGIQKARRLREFDTHGTAFVGKFGTADAYYRRCTSTDNLVDVAVPLLCITALDDPICTNEAIPWHECRLNKNIVLATTQHGGHLGFFEGVTASSLWWVRAVNEYLSVLHASPFMHTQEKISSPHHSSKPSIDQNPFLNITQNGMIDAVEVESTKPDLIEDSSELHKQDQESVHKQVPPSSSDVTCSNSSTALIKQRLYQISRSSRRSMPWLLYVAAFTSWPLLGSVLYFFFKRRVKKVSKM